MQTLTRWLFGLTVYGTLVIPVVLMVAAWRTTQGDRLRRVLRLTAAWLVVSVVATTARLATNDAYYAPTPVTHWAEASSPERRLIVGLLSVTGVTAGVLVALARRRTLRAAAAVSATVGAWLICTWMLLAALLLGLH